MKGRITMKDINYFRKKMLEQEQEQAKLAGNLEKLKQDRAALEEQINAAIDADELLKVDQLTAKETELDNRIRAAEKILERKREKAGLDLAEIAAANNEEMQKYQDKVDAGIKEAQKIQRLYYETLIKTGEIVHAANDTRAKYLQIAGIDIENAEFISVHGNYFVPQLRPGDAEIVNSIKMGGSAMIYILNQ